MIAAEYLPSEARAGEVIAASTRYGVDPALIKPEPDNDPELNRDDYA